MTFDDDFVQLTAPGFEKGVGRFFLKNAGLSWPPPEILRTFGAVWELRRMSGITDVQRQGMSHVIRGAEYVLSLKSTDIREKGPLDIRSMSKDAEKGITYSMELTLADPCPICGGFNMAVGDYACYGACYRCADEAIREDGNHGPV